MHIFNIIILSLLTLFAGCSTFQNPFTRDPFTGGKNVSRSSLLDITLPPGFQLYPSHSKVVIPEVEGMETYRGYTGESEAAYSVFESLKASGWQLRLSLRTDGRAVYLYQNDSSSVILVFRKQGMLTIMEIWKGNKLPDNSVIEQMTQHNLPSVESGMFGEEFGPEDETTSVYEWGQNLEERNL